jgi:flagellar hook protein FlgE
MFSGVSGLRSHQTMMDVIGNNIANVNTIGYKGANTVFQDVLSQALQGAGAPGPGQNTGIGGTNASQVGLGVRVGSIATNFNQGSAQLTGRATDLSIQGDGFFVVRQGGQELFTRAGSLSFDALGRMTTPDGAVIQGWPADATGVVNSNAGVSDITVPVGQAIAPTATKNVTIGGNLDAATVPGSPPVKTSITVYDNQGSAIDVTFSFAKSTDVAKPNTWVVTPSAVHGVTGLDTPLATAEIAWDPAGEPPAFDVESLEIDMGGTGWEFDTVITVGIGEQGDPKGLQQFASPSGVQASYQDGSTMGSLQSFTIGQDGTVTGVFSNGRNQSLGQIAMANFANPVGLEKVGGSMYRTSVNSGLAQVGVANTNGRGILQASTLEMSNVDLAAEFTNLIVAQRGFQANSRVITASDELLQDLVNLKR